MAALIANLLAEASSSAFRGHGSGYPILTPRPNGRQVPVPRKGGEPLVIGLTLIKIVVNLGR
jgi:hypothetical protein